MKHTDSVNKISHDDLVLLFMQSIMEIRCIYRGYEK